MTDEELKNLHAREVNEWEQFDVMWGENRKDYQYLGMLFEAYGDRRFYRNKKTGEVVSVYISIGD